MMTEHERVLLTATAAKTDAMHRVFMEISPSGDPPLVQRLIDMAIILERSSWATKWFFRVILTIGGASAALATIWANSKGIFK
jgi:hypothetical protein